MNVKNTVTLSLEEYKELVLKSTVVSQEKLIYEKLKDLIKGHIKYGFNYPATEDNIEVKNVYEFSRDLLYLIKLLDRPMYLEFVKEVEMQNSKKITDEDKMEKKCAVKDTLKGGDK
jgi:hypothetical protein